MASEIPWETRCRAEDLYVIDGLTYEQVALETGVSISQLKRWGADEDWSSRKKEYRDALSGIRRNTVQLRKKLIENALQSLDPQAVYAAARMEQVAAAGSKPAGNRPAQAALPDMEINTPADAVHALQKAMENRLAKMAGGEIDLAGIKQVHQSLELIEKLKAKYVGEDQKQQALTADQIADIKEQLKI